jgi:hypothetical protein
MQSSVGVTFRALLMLACVIGIPAIALSGTSWSELLKKFQKIEMPAILNLASASAPVKSDQATKADRNVCPTGQDQNVGFTGQNQNVGPTGQIQSGGSLADMPPRTSPATVRTNTAEANLLANAEIPPGIHDIENKLQRFGATYYVLEAWGSDQQLFRFYCKMAVGGNADYTHCFEATDADPLQAMLHVLKQVEAWREGEGLPKAPARV